MKKFNLSKGLIVGLLTFALCIVAFAAVGAKADEQAAASTPTKTTAVAASYDAANDTVTSTVNQTAYVYVVKAASGNKIKSGQTAAGQMAGGKIAISDLGIKGTNKDVFLYVCDKEVEVADGETVSANLTIKGNANKVVGVVDYTQADDSGSVKVLSAYYVDKASKKSVDIASAKLYWAAEAEGPFYLANDGTVGSGTTGRKVGNDYVKNGFTGKDLADMLEAGGTIYIKQAGTDGATGTAQFGSKVAKVKIAKQAKAPKAKIDVAKDTIALKNGFDFAVATKNAETKEYDIVKWFTILPNLKTATTGDAIVGGVIGTGNNAKETAYHPLGKKATNAGKVVTVANDSTNYYSYTNKQIKALSIDKLFEYVSDEFWVEENDEWVLSFPEEGDYKIAVRKSATEKKPASAYTLIDLSFPTDSPIVWTQDNVKGQFLVASADEFSKKGLSLGDIKGFAGYTGTNSLAIATTGYYKDFDLAAASESIKGRDDGTTFEYTVVDTKDFAATGDDAIDWTTVKWKKFDPAKLKITEKLSGKYNTVKGTKKAATLAGTAAGDLSKGESATDLDEYGRVIVKDTVVKTGTKALLLIRRQGDKSSSKRASKYIALYVAKEGKKYNLYSTVSNGAEAFKYEVKFYTYKTPSADSNVYGINFDDSIDVISGWGKDSDEYVDFPVIEKTEFFTITENQYGMSAGEKISAEASGDNQGKYLVHVPAALGDGEDKFVKKVYVRGIANVTFKAVFGTLDNGQFKPLQGEAFTKDLIYLKNKVAGKYNEEYYTAEATKGKLKETTLETDYYTGQLLSFSVAEMDPYVPAGYAKVVSLPENYKLFEATGEGYIDGEVSGNGQSYKVRLVSTDDVVVEVKIPVSLITYTVAVATGSEEGATITNNTSAAPGNTVTFKVSGVTPTEGKKLVVKNGNEELTADNGTYTVTIPQNATANVQISITVVDA